MLGNEESSRSRSIRCAGHVEQIQRVAGERLFQLFRVLLDQLVQEAREVRGELRPHLAIQREFRLNTCVRAQIEPRINRTTASNDNDVQSTPSTKTEGEGNGCDRCDR